LHIILKGKKLSGLVSFNYQSVQAHVD